MNNINALADILPKNLPLQIVVVQLLPTVASHGNPTILIGARGCSGCTRGVLRKHMVRGLLAINTKLLYTNNSVARAFVTFGKS